VTTNAYTPGVNQDVTVQLNDPTALNFGFQLTARLKNDPTKQAGSFTSPTVSTQVRCAPDGHLAPCGDAVEYVTHTSAQPPGGQGTRTYVITWTPPGRNLGPVVFYAAGVAGSGEVVTSNSIVTGDRVYTTPETGIQVSPSECNLTGPPTFQQTSAVTDAASYRNTISSEQLISIFGSNFLPNTQTQGYRAGLMDLVNGNWPTELACVAVEITGVRVPLFFVGPGQINAQAPNFTPGQLADVKVILNPDTANQLVSPVMNVSAGPLAPALFTFNGRGSGNAAALDATKGYAYLADTSVVPTGVSAAPGDVISLYGTGFGPTNPAYLPGVFADPQAPLPRLTTSPVTVTFGNSPGVTVSDSDIFYAGLAFDAPGLYQVNVRVPDVPDGDQPVSVRVGTSVTQGGVTIPVKK
jgi:uncharacterized protein (TIGR03437 family)